MNLGKQFTPTLSSLHVVDYFTRLYKQFTRPAHSFPLRFPLFLLLLCAISGLPTLYLVSNLFKHLLEVLKICFWGLGTCIFAFLSHLSAFLPIFWVSFCSKMCNDIILSNSLWQIGVFQPLLLIGQLIPLFWLFCPLFGHLGPYFRFFGVFFLCFWVSVCH